MSDQQPSSGYIPQSWIYFGILVAGVVFLGANVIWGYGIATAASVATGVMIAVALACRPDWQHKWFWLTYGVLTLIHLVALFIIPWSDARTPGYYVIPWGFFDVFACLGIIWLVEKAQ